MIAVHYAFYYTTFYKKVNRICYELNSIYYNTADKKNIKITEIHGLHRLQGTKPCSIIEFLSVAVSRFLSLISDTDLQCSK